MSATPLTWGGRSIPGPGGLPAVAVSLTGPRLAHARAQARSAVEAGADVLELRVDLLEEAGALAASDPLDAATATAQVLECLRGLREAIDAADGADADGSAPVLLTCRTAAEGGRAALGRHRRRGPARLPAAGLRAGPRSGYRRRRLLPRLRGHPRR